MYHLRQSLETPAANLALDEELLARAEAGVLPGGVLRLWEAAAPCVVLGRSSPEHEVHAAHCRDDGVPVLRRVSGGATVVIGPGCLMYAVVLDRRDRPDLGGVDQVHAFVLGRMVDALAPLGRGVRRAGTSDLAVAPPGDALPRKFSGNSLRLKRRALLYHGTILYDFPLERVARWLAMPVRQPAYRAERDHREFLANLGAERGAIEQRLIDAWDARSALPP
jgi:lipoate-protein ligase A